MHGPTLVCSLLLQNLCYNFRPLLPFFFSFLPTLPKRQCSPSHCDTLDAGFLLVIVSARRWCFLRSWKRRRRYFIAIGAIKSCPCIFFSLLPGRRQRHRTFHYDHDSVSTWTSNPDRLMRRELPIDAGGGGAILRLVVAQYIRAVPSARTATRLRPFRDHEAASAWRLLPTFIPPSSRLEQPRCHRCLHTESAVPGASPGTRTRRRLLHVEKLACSPDSMGSQPVLCSAMESQRSQWGLARTAVL